MEESDLFKNLSTFTFPKPVPVPNDGSEDVESIETTASSDNEVYPLGNKSTISPKATIFVGELNKPSSPNSSTAMPNHKRITNLVYSNCNENGLSLSPSPGKSAGVNRTISFPPISPINTKFEWDKSPRQPTLYKTRSSATMESSFYQSPNTLQSSPQSDDYATARYLNDNRPLSSPSERGSFASSGRKFHHRRSLSISSPKSIDFSPNSNRFSFAFSNVEETNTSNYHLEVSREFHDTAPIDCEAQNDFILEEENDCDHYSYSEEPLMLYKNFDDRNTDIVSRPTASSSGVSIGEAQKVKIQRPSVVYLVSSPTNLELDLDIISNTEQ